MSTGSAPARDSELASYRIQLVAVDAEVSELVDGLSPSQLTWQPSPTQWSMADCLEHLRLTVIEYQPGFEAAIEKGRRENLRRAGPFRHGGWLRNYLIRAVEPPPKHKVRTRPAFTPSPGKSPDAVLRDFRESQRLVKQWIANAEGLDLARLRVSHPSIGLLRWTLGQAFAQLLGHQRRHVWQAWQVRKHPQFPPG